MPRAATGSHPGPRADGSVEQILRRLANPAAQGGLGGLRWQPVATATQIADEKSVDEFKSFCGDRRFSVASVCSLGLFCRGRRWSRSHAGPLLDHLYVGGCTLQQARVSSCGRCWFLVCRMKKLPCSQQALAGFGRLCPTQTRAPVTWEETMLVAAHLWQSASREAAWVCGAVRFL